MENNERLLYGLIITAVVFISSIITGIKLPLNIEFLPYSFVTHSLMLILSIGLIYGLRKHVTYKIAFPQFKKILKPILFGILAALITNISITIITVIFGGKVETHVALTNMSPFQFFVFIFIYSSIAEEMLFRGFLMNILKPLKAKGIKIFNRNISVPVLISAVAFGLIHLILITSGANGLFLLRIVVFTTVLGVVAGYYQEKHDNNAFAIIVHMAGNTLGVIAAFLMHLNV